MEQYPLVVGSFAGYPTEPTPEWLNKMDYISVSGGNFDEVRHNAMSAVSSTHGDTMFWFWDSRYDLLVEPKDWNIEKVDCIYAFQVANTFGNKATLDGDPYDDHGGFYFLPSLDRVKSGHEFLTYDEGAQMDDSRPILDASDFMAWPIKVSSTEMTRKRYPYSVFVLQHDEPTGMSNLLIEAVQNFMYAPHVERFWSAMSIRQAHQTLARNAESDMFLVLDADFKPDLSSVGKEFPREVFEDEKAFVHLWPVRNPINGLVYGHGGPKLFNRDHFLWKRARDSVDVTLSVGDGITVYENCVGTHAFNWSAFSTWRTALREAAKLHGIKHDQQAALRLHTWTDRESQDFSQPFAEHCLAGARKGVELALKTVNKGWINDYTYLRSIFGQEFGVNT